MRRSALVAAALLATAVFAGSTQATPGVTADTVFNRLKAFWHEHDLEAPFRSAEPLGDDGLLFRGIEIEAKEPPAEGQVRPSLKIDSLAVTGLSPLGKDGFSARTYDIGNVAMEFPVSEGAALSLRIGPSGGTGLHIVPTDSTELPFSRTMPTTFRLGRLTAAVGGKEVVAVSGVESSVWFDESGDLLTMKSSMPQALVPLEALPSRGRAQLQALGLDRLMVSLSSSGAWNIPAGRMVLNEYRIELANAGAISLSMVLRGYTLDWYRRVRDSARRAQNAGPANIEAQKLASAEMMAALGELKIESVKLDFRDGAITRRLLTTQAQALGMSEEELAGSVPGLIGGYLAIARNPQFSEQAAEAIKTFLAEPGAISLIAAPPEPVAVTEIIEAVLNAPERLVPLLGAKVAANP